MQLRIVPPSTVHKCTLTLHPYAPSWHNKLRASVKPPTQHLTLHRREAFTGVRFNRITEARIVSRARLNSRRVRGTRSRDYVPVTCALPARSVPLLLAESERAEGESRLGDSPVRRRVFRVSHAFVRALQLISASRLRSKGLRRSVRVPSIDRCRGTEGRGASVVASFPRLSARETLVPDHRAKSEPRVLWIASGSSIHLDLLIGKFNRSFETIAVVGDRGWHPSWAVSMQVSWRVIASRCIVRIEWISLGNDRLALTVPLNWVNCLKGLWCIVDSVLDTGCLIKITDFQFHFSHLIKISSTDTSGASVPFSIMLPIILIVSLWTSTLPCHFLHDTAERRLELVEKFSDDNLINRPGNLSSAQPRDDKNRGIKLSNQLPNTSHDN